MSDTVTPTDRPRRKAQSTTYEERVTIVKKMIADENAVIDAKTAKLRALRVAREEAEREAAASPPLKKKTRAA